MPQVSKSPGEGRWLHRFAVVTAFSTWVLIWAGGLVTSTGSGLAVPDWPLSYGMLMPPMVGGVLYEHTHRLIAAGVGLLTTVLGVWLWRSESRRWLRVLGLVALGMVIAQGVLGGLTVIYLLPASISVAHAVLAQTFFCVMVLLAFATSREWKEAVPPEHPARLYLPGLAAGATAAVYLQLILGALVRHTGAGLAIPDFPLAFGRLVPPLDQAGVALHFAHRLAALVVAGCLGWLSVHIWRNYPRQRRLLIPALSLFGLLLLQILLGAAVIWTKRAPVPATAHVATGALLLGGSWLLTLRAFLPLVPSRGLLRAGVVGGAGRRDGHGGGHPIAFSQR